MAVEEQTTWNTYLNLHGEVTEEAGQRLTIPGRQVTHLGFWLRHYAGASGDVVFGIRKVSDNSEIVTKKWGDAGDLTTSPTYYEVEFDTPTTINEEVRLFCRFVGPGDTFDVLFCKQNTDVKAEELLTYYHDAAWEDKPDEDAAYRYTYELPGWTGKISGVTNPAKVMGVDVANIASVKGVA